MIFTFELAKKAFTTMFNPLFGGHILMNRKCSQDRGKKLFSPLAVLGLITTILICNPAISYSNNAVTDEDNQKKAGIKIQKVNSSELIVARDQSTISNGKSLKTLKSDYLEKSVNTWREDSAGTSAELVDKENTEEPTRFQLKQNYPNPFNPATEITYKLPVARHVVLKVYDMLGRPIKTLVNTDQEAGNYTIRFNAGSLSSGMYIYRLEAGDYEQIRKMILIK